MPAGPSGTSWEPATTLLKYFLVGRGAVLAMRTGEPKVNSELTQGLFATPPHSRFLLSQANMLFAEMHYRLPRIASEKVRVALTSLSLLFLVVCFVFVL